MIEVCKTEEDEQKKQGKIPDSDWNQKCIHKYIHINFISCCFPRRRKKENNNKCLFSLFFCLYEWHRKSNKQKIVTWPSSTETKCERERKRIEANIDVQKKPLGNPLERALCVWFMRSNVHVYNTYIWLHAANQCYRQPYTPHHTIAWCDSSLCYFFFLTLSRWIRYIFTAICLHTVQYTWV